MSWTPVNLAARRRRLRLARAGLWAVLAALVGSAAAVPLLAVRSYREVLQYAYGAPPLRMEPPASPTAGPAPAAPTPAATLRVRSDPDGCVVYLDQQYLGRTPLTASGVSFGRHTLELKRFPFESASRSLELKRNVEEVSVELRQRTGQVLLLGPGGATVLVDGERVGSLPLGALELPAGPHQFEVQGAVTWFKTIEIIESQRLTYDVSTSSSLTSEAPPPAPRPRPGASGLEGSASLLVNAHPWAEVLFDGRSMGFSPLLLTNVPPGTHTLDVSRRGYVTEKRVLHLQPGERASVSLKLSPKD
jgi:PEGA domain-containing protein